MKQELLLCNNSGQFALLLSYFQSSLHNQAKIHRSALATEIIFPYWMIHWQLLSAKGRPFVLQCLSQGKENHTNQQAHWSDMSFPFEVNVHKNLCGIHRYATAAKISIQCHKSDEMCFFLSEKRYKCYLSSLFRPILPSPLTQPGCRRPQKLPPTFILEGTRVTSRNNPRINNSRPHSFARRGMEREMW